MSSPASNQAAARAARCARRRAAARGARGAAGAAPGPGRARAWRAARGARAGSPRPAPARRGRPRRSPRAPPAHTAVTSLLHLFFLFTHGKYSRKCPALGVAPGNWRLRSPSWRSYEIACACAPAAPPVTVTSLPTCDGWM